MAGSLSSHPLSSSTCSSRLSRETTRPDRTWARTGTILASACSPEGTTHADAIVGWNNRILAIAVAMLIVHGASADPLTFYGVYAQSSDASGNVTTIDLFSNPGAVLSGQEIFLPELNRSLAFVGFNVPVTGLLPPGSTDTLRLTFQVPDVGQPPCCRLVQEALIPSGFIQPGNNTYVWGFGLAFPLVYRPVPMSLTVDLLQSSPDFVIPSGPHAGQAVDSYTYTFSVVQPVPEPATILLLGAGLGVATLVGRRRRTR